MRRIFVAGHKGLVGSAICRALGRAGLDDLILRERAELDLRDRAAVSAMFAKERPEHVFLAAAKVGGIKANSEYPADFILDNLRIQDAIIGAAAEHGVRKFLFLGSSCVYPKHAPQPIPESALLSGPLEPTNEPYAVAKIAGITLVQALRRQCGFPGISAMPTNLYGPGETFDLDNSHVLAALIRRFHEARESGAASVELWGTGTPRREFLHADDLADALLVMMREYDDATPLNVGCGKDISISDLARMVAEVIGFDGEIRFDPSMPDGTPRKLLDVSRLTELGWTPKIGLRDGIEQTYRWYREAVVGKPREMRN